MGHFWRVLYIVLCAFSGVQYLLSAVSILSRYFDFHIGGDSLYVAGDWALMNIARDYLRKHGSKIRGVVLEENGGLHSIQRALGHARRSNRLHCLGDFMRADTPANGLQVLGHNDNSWDQGQVFISQNTSYLAPCGVAQIMLSKTYGDSTVTVTMPSLVDQATLDVAATRNGSALTVRVVNTGMAPLTASLHFEGCSQPPTSASLLTLAGSLTAQNYPGDQRKIW